MRPFQKELSSNLISRLNSTKALVILGIILLFSIAGLKDLKLSANYRVYFDPDSSLYQLDQSISDKYKLTDSLLLVLSSDIDFLEERAWNSVRKLTDVLTELPPVTQVKNYQIIAESNNSQPYNAEFDEEWQANKTLAERQKLYFTHPRAAQVLSQDGRTALLKIEVDLGGNPSARNILSFNQSVAAQVNQFRAEFPFISNVRFGGVQTLNKAYIEVVRHDLKFFIPGLFVIFSIGLYFFYRDTRVIAIVLSCGFLSVLSAFGVAGWFGFNLAAINAFVPVIIVSISIATSAHLFTIFFQKLRANNDVDFAITSSIKENFLAISLSNLTTAAGFILLLSSPSPPVRVVGILVATGTLFSYLCSQLLLPFLVSKYLNKVAPKRLEIIHKTSNLENFKRQLLANPKMAYAMLAIFLAISIAGFVKLEVNDNVYEYFPENHQFSLTTQDIKTEFGGISRIVLSVDSGKDYGVLDKDY
ncbi:MAG: MMPL family transporter, partial [Kangiellaceae bacterium]|nr:MMPL family transporter [Kangiellaceae bacterium]